MKENYYVVAKTISRWKLNNWFENWLGYKADKSEFFKTLYLLYYKFFDNKYYKGSVKLADKEIERQLNIIAKEVPLNHSYIRKDMIYSLHRFGVSFLDYFVYKFYDKNYIGRSKFNTLKLQYGYCELVNNAEIRELFEDKGACYKILKDYYKRELVVVYGENEYIDLCNFIERHKNFIFKPLKGYSGIGIKFFNDFHGTVRSFYDANIIYGAFVVEELIVQAPEMAAIYKESVNTVRLSSFKIEDDVIIVGGALRMGAGGSNVDNAGSGGLYATIDVEHGIVCSLARDKVNGNMYSLHPDTQFKLVGFELPKWAEAIDLVKKLAFVIKGATAISWDLAYSVHGWIVVEGNDVGDPNLLQAPLQIGIKYKYHELIDKYFKS